MQNWKRQSRLRQWPRGRQQTLDAEKRAPGGLWSPSGYGGAVTGTGQCEGKDPRTAFRPVCVVSFLELCFWGRSVDLLGFLRGEERA